METKKGTPVPADFAEMLAADTRVQTVFERMRPSCQERYVRWSYEAKKPETRARRVRRTGELILDYGRRHEMIA